MDFLNVIALSKSEQNEKYVFIFDNESYSQLVEVFHEFASDDSLSFSFFDAKTMTDRASRLMSKNGFEQ